MSVTELIRRRRSIFPPVYNGAAIKRTDIEEILENANWAPNHKHTAPWRFKVFHTEPARRRLSDFLAAYYKDNTAAEKFLQKKYEKTQKKPLQSACVIAICMQRDPEERVPEWEEIAAVACAVQNMWLTASEKGIGAYWSSPGAIRQAGELLDLQPGERCLGFFFMGYYDSPHPESKRESISDKTVWL